MFIWSKPPRLLFYSNIGISECSDDFGSLQDVLPLCTFQTDHLSLDFDFNQFKIASCNINSILCQGRLQQIEEILKSNNFTAICLQETKIY